MIIFNLGESLEYRKIRGKTILVLIAPSLIDKKIQQCYILSEK